MNYTNKVKGWYTYYFTNQYNILITHNVQHTCTFGEKKRNVPMYHTLAALHLPCGPGLPSNDVMEMS